MLTKIINNQRTVVDGSATKFIGSTVPVDDIDAADTIMNKIRVPHMCTGPALEGFIVASKEANTVSA